jgi:hypothetical protein
MKCNCGFENEYITFENGQKGWSSETEFINTKLTITINERQGEWDHDRLCIKHVFICPKCGTLKVDL